jgi:hypothetical protein
VSTHFHSCAFIWILFSHSLTPSNNILWGLDKHISYLTQFCKRWTVKATLKCPSAYISFNVCQPKFQYFRDCARCNGLVTSWWFPNSIKIMSLKISFATKG